MLYVLAWLATGAVVAGALLFALRGGDDSPASLPPVRQTELRAAAQQAGCELRSGAHDDPGEPPTTGAPASPAAAQFYEAPLPASSLVGAIRRGVIVISYRPDVPQDLREALRAVQMTVPDGTIVAPNPRMPYVIAATGWRRLLACSRADLRILDALRLFRGRFIGQGPDSPP